MKTRHFLTIADLGRDEVAAMLKRALELKTLKIQGVRPPILRHKTLAMIFEKSSTRTRVSFETAMADGGGSAIFLSSSDSQLGRGEPPEDTARVLSEMVDVIMVRTYEQDVVNCYAEYATVPVINGLTNQYHPCQVLTDVFTFFEVRGDIRGATVAWIGDGNNMCNSYINAAELMGFNLRVASPVSYEPTVALGSNTTLVNDPGEAADGADLVVTDSWVSMGQESEKKQREKAFLPYQVDSKIMGLAAPDALFMHCLPAHRGQEVAADVIDHPNSLVWREAGNRLHMQKALLEFLIVQNSKSSV
jgi:ornithine carbamoyltransferase